MKMVLKVEAIRNTEISTKNELVINKAGYFIDSAKNIVAKMEETAVLKDKDDVWHNLPEGMLVESISPLKRIEEEGNGYYLLEVTGDLPLKLEEDMKPMKFEGMESSSTTVVGDKLCGEELWKAKFKVNASVQDMMDVYTSIVSEVEAASEECPYDNDFVLIDGVFGITLAMKTPKVVESHIEDVVTPIAAFNAIGKNLKENGYVDTPEMLRKLMDEGFKPVIIGNGTGSGVGKAGPYRIDVKFVKKSEEELKKEEIELVKAKKAEGPTLEELMKDVVVQGYVDEKELKMRVDYMRENEVPDRHICWILKHYQKPKRPVVKPKKVYVEVYSDKEPLIKRLIRNAVTGHNVILEGAKSVGKNVALETMAWLRNMNIEILKMSAQMTQDEMLGNHSTDNSAKDAISAQGAMALLKVLFGKSPEEATEEAAKFLSDSVKCTSTSLTFQLGIMAQWLVDGYGILVLDEMNMALANTLSRAVNSLADDHTEWYEIPGYGTVKIPENCVLYGTQNDSTYCGTNSQNDATYSRFQKIIMPMPETILNILKEENPGVSNGILKLCDDIFQEIRAEHNESLDPALSIRGILRALENVVEEQPLKEALIESVVNHVEDPEDRQVILDILDRKIAD